MTAARQLVSLQVSPWSERAKWALDHHGLDYEVRVHVPVLGEGRLRKLVGPSQPKATAPVLIDGARVISDSLDIALYADDVGRGTKLFPAEHDAAIRAWVARADEAMNAARGLIFAGMLDSPAALDEAAPSFVPAWARSLLRPVTRNVMRTLVRKYGASLHQREEQKKQLRVALDALRKGLGVGAMHLFGSFTYADIAAASLLQAVAPVDQRWIKLRPATRAVWTNADLARDYADLVTWRDRLYEARRKP